MMILKAVAKIVSIVLATALAGFFPPGIEAFQYDLVGQLSGWHREINDRDLRRYQSGLRYIPQLTLTRSLGPSRLLDLEASLNATIVSSHLDDEAELDLYRLKLRFSTAQTETRLGLQRLNFGPARLLRPLRWFDNLDPRDPLGLTDGVYALRFRYVALNNTSLWLWELLGNDDPKGDEVLPTEQESVELGGRLQLPLPRGEGAFTFHRRRVDASTLPISPHPGPAPPLEPGETGFTENRFALDGRWDIEIGLWFEAVLQQQRCKLLSRPWRKTMTLGADYTLGLGNGLHVLCEHMATVSSRKAPGWHEDIHVSAYSLNYPIGYLDNLQAIGYYSWEDRRYYQYLAWARTWDNWMLSLSLFHYPDANDRQELDSRMAPDSGTGGQVLVIFNH